mmetsp:Transcript_14395/g.31811  ORF Transcript_14395/g.31811 Transcript_14395/m.31811 type:complete len:202 (+) Transcript_14395:1641-2246(+)
MSIPSTHWLLRPVTAPVLGIRQCIPSCRASSSARKKSSVPSRAGGECHLRHPKQLVSPRSSSSNDKIRPTSLIWSRARSWSTAINCQASTSRDAGHPVFLEMNWIRVTGELESRCLTLADSAKSKAATVSSINFFCCNVSLLPCRIWIVKFRHSTVSISTATGMCATSTLGSASEPRTKMSSNPLNSYNGGEITCLDRSQS